MLLKFLIIQMLADKWVNSIETLDTMNTKDFGKRMIHKI